MCLLFPDEWHSYAPDKNTGWAEAWIGCKGVIPQQWVEKGFFVPEKTILDIGVSSRRLDMFNRAYEAAHQQSPAYQQLLAGYVNMIGSIVYSPYKGMQYKNNHIVNNVSSTNSEQCKLCVNCS